MNSNWHECKNILCIRPDNMGDLLMSGPAIRALKQSFNCKITVLTSTMAAGVANLMPEVDEVLIFDAPWVKTSMDTASQDFTHAVDQVSQHHFDAAVIFTVYSQNPLPTVMLAYLAGIPLRLAYCRENPYNLLTHWLPDKEPYTLIKHQVRRDLDLVASVGASTSNEKLNVAVDATQQAEVPNTLQTNGIDLTQPWVIVHPGVSEKKREYPIERWIEATKQLSAQGYQIVITGTASERSLCSEIEVALDNKCFNAAGCFNLKQFIALISLAPLVISVNTGTVHIAAATATPVVVLYALTNPQHTPWLVPNHVLTFPVPSAMQSKNEVIKYVNQPAQYADKIPTADDILKAALALLKGEKSVTEPLIIGQPRPAPEQNSVQLTS